MSARSMILAVALLAPTAAVAQPAQPTIALPAADVSHAIAYLNDGGTYAEAHALADKLLSEAQADVTRQQAAAKDEAQKTGPKAP